MIGEILSRARAPGRLRASAQPQQVRGVDPVARTDSVHRNNLTKLDGKRWRQSIATAAFVIIATGAYCVAPGASIRAEALSTTVWAANLTPDGPMMIWETAWNCDDLDVPDPGNNGNMMQDPDVIPGNDNNHCYRRAHGYNRDGFSDDYGRLTDDDFSLDGVDYKVAWVFQDSRGIHFQLFALSLQVEHGDYAPDFEGIFEVAGKSYNFDDYGQIGRGFGMCGPDTRPDCQNIDYKWSVPGLDWSRRSSISLKIIATSGNGGGDENSGDENSGDENSGDENSGDENSGDENSGDENGSATKTAAAVATKTAAVVAETVVAETAAAGTAT